MYLLVVYIIIYYYIIYMAIGYVMYMIRSYKLWVIVDRANV